MVQSGVKRGNQTIAVNDVVFTRLFLKNSALVYWEVYDTSPVEGLDGVRFIYISSLPANSVNMIEFKLSKEVVDSLGGEGKVSLFYYDQQDHSWKAVSTQYLGVGPQGYKYFRAEVPGDGLYGVAPTKAQPKFPSGAVIAIIVVAAVVAIGLAYYMTIKKG